LRQAVAEKSPELVMKTFDMKDAEFFAFMSEYSQSHIDSISSEFLLQDAILERQRRQIYADAQRQFEAMPLSEKAMRYAIAAKDATMEYASEFADDPCGHAIDLTLGTAYFAGDLAVPGGLEAPASFVRGETSLGQAVVDQTTSVGAEYATGLFAGKIFRAGKKAGAALVHGEKALQKAIVAKIAGKNAVVTREKRWMQLADEGKLPKEVIETIRRTGGKGIKDIHGLELAHLPGKPAYRGFDYSDALPKTTSIHRGSHHRFYKDLPNGGIQVRPVPKPENVFSHPKGGVFKRLDEVEKAIKK
jgi:hypothetical protein